MAVVGDDHELALEEALQRIGGDAAVESDDEDGMSVVGYEAEEDEAEQPALSRVYTTARTTAGGHIASSSSSSSAVSLKDLLVDVRSFMLFRRFLKDQCITRNLQFWLACEYYNKQTPEIPVEGTKMAKAVYCRFLKSSAPLHVSILDNTKRRIGTVVQFGTAPDSSLLLEAQQEVYQQMEVNELRQFLCSDAFSECSQFSGFSGYGSTVGEMVFQPSRYRTGASLHSSDDSTSVTSFTSEDAGSTHTQVLCLPPHTRNVYTPRNAHSDTEHSSSSHRHRRHPSGLTTHISRNQVLTQNEFYEIVCEKLSSVQRERAAMKQRARNIARIAGKSYEDIMSIDWFDAPDSIRYARFDDETQEIQSPGLEKPVGSTSPSNMSNSSSNTNCSHLISFGFREVQEAMKELDIASQVRQKRSSILSSSASSYISDSGVGESNLPSSGSGAHRTPNRVQAYVQNQQRVFSQQSEREIQAQLAATVLMNNSIPKEELNPYHNRLQHYNNFPGAYSSDDSSSCFTATSHSSNSEFFVPRRPHPLYGDSNEDTSRHSHHPRYPPGMRRLPPSSRRPPASSRYLPNQTPPTTTPSRPPSQQGAVTLNTVPSLSPAIHSDTLLVAYSWEGKTYANKLQVKQLSLGEFKEKMFKRKGQYRFFFKSFCEELSDVILEEISDDSATLPLYEGKIVGQVEPMQDL